MLNGEIPASLPDGGARAPHLRVLIVDDEPMLRSVIEEYLVLLGYKPPAMAGDGREALAILRAQPIDCMISDIRMPEMALEELLAILGKEFPRLVVLATSGYSDFDNAFNIIEKGAHDFLGKPLNLDFLEDALGWVEQRQSMLELAAELFGGDADHGSPNQDAAMLDRLGANLMTKEGAFAGRLRHARRMAKVARGLQGLFEPAEWRDLELAALLHEIGNSQVMQSLIEQSRRLDEHELRLVRAHARASGRLVARHLGLAEVGAIIAKHYHWGQALASQGTASRSRTDRLATWLGLLNFVDGCLRNRPDRMPYTTTQVRDSLKRRLQATSLEPIKALLDHWAVVEQAYPPA
jgi:response regulator RpfG family c-di-GMP phosphodiesterase